MQEKKEKIDKKNKHFQCFRKSYLVQSVKNPESAKAANQYIKLVTKYFVDDKEYQLLVDNDILIKLLEKQELIEEEVERTSWRPEIITWIKYAGKIPSIFFEATALYKGEKVWYNSTVKNKNQRKSKVNIL